MSILQCKLSSDHLTLRTHNKNALTTTKWLVCIVHNISFWLVFRFYVAIVIVTRNKNKGRSYKDKHDTCTKLNLLFVNQLESLLVLAVWQITFTHWTILTNHIIICTQFDDQAMMKVCRDGEMDEGMYYWLLSCLRVTQMLHPQIRWVTMNHQVFCVCACVCDVPDLNVSKVRIWVFLTFFLSYELMMWFWENTLIIWNTEKHKLSQTKISLFSKFFISEKTMLVTCNTCIT